MERPNDRTALTRKTPWARWGRRWVLTLMAVAGLLAVGFVPTQTKQGIDYSVSTHTLPLYAKALDFVQRYSSYARLASQIAREHGSPEARALAIFEWTRESIRDTPAGFPVIDDHVSHIIIRGYGEPDQKADVFTALTTYAGVPAFWTQSGNAPSRPVLSYVWIDRGWRVFDVENGIIFRNRQGALASAEELAQDRSLTRSYAADPVYRAKGYDSYFDDFRSPIPPDILRSELQMLWPRASYRVKRLVGLGRREWQDGR